MDIFWVMDLTIEVIVSNIGSHTTFCFNSFITGRVSFKQSCIFLIMAKSFISSIFSFIEIVFCFNGFIAS